MARYVLVIDDEEPIQQFISRALTSEGYEVAGAPDGAQAFTMINQRTPDLILLDMWLPVMDGKEFLKQYRATIQKRIPIVVMTADHVSYPDSEAALVSGLLIKPFGFDDLLGIVQKHLPRIVA
jgi:DNA-binding response OmpR family regulator